MRERKFEKSHIHILGIR